MEISRYPELKAANLVTVAKIGSAHAFLCKRFDKDTGAELPPEVSALDKAQLLAEKGRLTKAIAAIDLLLTDLAALG